MRQRAGDSPSKLDENGKQISIESANSGSPDQAMLRTLPFDSIMSMLTKQRVVLPGQPKPESG